ncbi:MAG: hypothetical protein KAI29_00150, partial [Cyclobacteriaceae bacterium]|nr:hypothetical protein [Cyclobacteriaceae bacterium]
RGHLINNEKTGQGFESGFGEYGLAWIGNIVLLFGITFLMQYIQNKGHYVVSTIFGYFTVAGIFLLHHYLKKSYSILSRTFNYTALVLMFYVTLHMHFFVSEPLIANKTIAFLLLLSVVILQLLYAVRRTSVIISGMAFVMLVFTALLSDSTHPILLILTAVSSISILFYFKIGWWRLNLLSIFLVYLGFFLWFIGNPLMGNPVGIISSHQYGFMYLFVIGAIYSLVAIENKKFQFVENLALSGVIINGFLFSLMLVLFVLTFFKTDYILLFFIIAIYCLAFSTTLKFRSAWKLAPAFYALYGFMALSIAVYGIYGFPRVYWLLSLQSLLVMTMALWFRNKIIVLLNVMMFVFLLCVYLVSSESINEVNFSFALVALTTARILKWKKDKLEIKTELLRNVYLFTAFVMVLYASYHSLPVKFITLSWTIIAIFYFVLRVAIKNVKYRYMALGTMVAAVFHLFVADLARIEIVYRVIAFLFLAIISLFVSVYYTRKQKNN